MEPEHLSKWQKLLEGIDKNHVPVQFIKKIVVKLVGKKQHTINIQSLLKQGLDPEEIEEVVSRKLNELDPLIVNFGFEFNVEFIADVVQPETDRLLNKL
jgi:hypothetical protein